MKQKIYIDDVKTLITKFPEKAVFWKDASYQYQGCNSFYAEKCGFEDFQQIVGLDDMIINPKYNMLYRNDDTNVIESKTTKHLYNPAFYPDHGNVFVEGTLNPVFDRHDHIFGVVGILEIKLNVFAGSFLSVLSYLKKHNISKFLNQKKYYLDDKKLISISKKELACYLYTEFLNLTTKQISNLIALSPRTVEKYIERVKEKKACVSAKCFEKAILEVVTQNC